METPQEKVNFVPVGAGETLSLGTLKIRIMEDGSRTQNRLGLAELFIPAQTPGPIPHWHEFHDECFLVTEGTVRFHTLNGGIIDAKAGDLVTVPTRSPHTFSNPFDADAKFINTYTPANYINYFKMLHSLSQEGKVMPAEANRKAMAYYGTIEVAEEEMNA